MGVQRFTGDDAGNVEPLGGDIDARCIVEFRPIGNDQNDRNNVWEGQYGFDWFRINDCEELTKSGLSDDKIINQTKNGFSHYLDHDIIVGKYATNGDFVNSYNCADALANYLTYKKIPRLTRRRNYIIPWISMGKPLTSIVKIKMIVKKDSTGIRNIRKIRVVSDEDYFVLYSDDSRASGKFVKKNGRVVFSCVDLFGPFNENGQEIKLTILYNENINKQIPANWAIKAYAFYNQDYTRNYNLDKEYHTLAGFLRIVNYSPLRVNILFVNFTVKAVVYNDQNGNPDITTSQLRTQRIGDSEIDKQKDCLERYLSQALVVPSIRTENLTMYVDERNLVRESSTLQFLNSDLGCSRNVAKTRDYGYVFMITGKNETRMKSGRKPVRLHEKLEEYVNSNDFHNGIYSGYYKIFFINGIGVSNYEGINKINTEGSLGGEAIDIDSKSAVVFSNPTDETVCHELLHCFGLYHSFSDKSHFTFKKCMTSNIMDYSFMVERGGNNGVVEKYNCLKLQSLGKWQWEMIRNKLNPDPQQRSAQLS